MRVAYSLHQHETLGVRNDLGGVESLLKVVKNLLLVAGEFDVGAGELLAGTSALGLQGGQASGEHGLTDQRDGLTHVEGVDGGPLARALLAGRVEDLLDERGAILIVVVEDVAGDFDEERVEHALVPLGKDIAHLLVAHAEATLHHIVCLLSDSSD